MCGGGSGPKVKGSACVPIIAIVQKIIKQMYLLVDFTLQIVNTN